MGSREGPLDPELPLSLESKELSSHLSSTPGAGSSCGKLALSQFPIHKIPARDIKRIPFPSRAFQAQQETELGLISHACHG